MKKSLIAAALAVSVLSGCTFGLNRKLVICKGAVTQQDMNLAGFDRIVINGSADLDYVQSDVESVRVRANSEVFPYLNYRVEDGALILETVDSVQLKAETFDVYVSGPVLKSLIVNGAADASISNVMSDLDLAVTVNGAGDMDLKRIQVPRLEVSINGAGDLEAEQLQVGKLSVNVQGAGDVELSGTAGEARISVSGAGDVDARELVCEKLETSKSGVAVIRTR